MKGKIAFVLGAAVGYVLGTRAGRERYEQIKRGAESLWNTAPVQRGVSVVKDAAQGRVDQLKDSVVKAGKGAFTALFRDDSKQESGSGSARPASSAKSAASSSAGADVATTAKSSASKKPAAAKKKPAAAKKAAAAKTSAAKAGDPDADGSGDA